MSIDDHVPVEMQRRIEAELEAMAVEHGVRILFAIESGSRAWGFPSRDSDWDVRFVYARPAALYLSVAERRDVIERPVDAVLDISGWDIRKALGLLIRSNAPLLEWLASPIRYRDDGSSAAALLAVARDVCELPALAYHYDRLARRSFEEIRQATAAIRLKAYCYALRPVLALLWMRRHTSVPPMNLQALRSGLELEKDLERTIDKLLAIKASASESGASDRLPVLDGFIQQCLEVQVPRSTHVERPDAIARADQVLAQIVGWSQR